MDENNNEWKKNAVSPPIVHTFNAILLQMGSPLSAPA